MYYGKTLLRMPKTSVVINLCGTQKDTTHHSHMLLTLHIPLDISESYHSELEQSVLQPDMIPGPSRAKYPF